MIGATALDMFLSAVTTKDVYTTFAEFISCVDIKAVVLFFALLFLTNKFKKHPIFYIVLAGFLGGIFKF